MQEYQRREFRLPECAACYSRLYYRDFPNQYLSATNFAPGLRTFAFGFLIGQKRIGENGKLFTLYKIKTMKAIPSSIHENGRSESRITNIGKYLRKYWIDEIPQLVNLLKGDLKLIGLRALPVPISHILPEEFRIVRSEFKPGLISISYADPSPDITGRIEAEKRYMTKYRQAPFSTDCIYLLRFFNNVFFKRVKSR